MKGANGNVDYSGAIRYLAGRGRGPAGISETSPVPQERLAAGRAFKYVGAGHGPACRIGLRGAGLGPSAAIGFCGAADGDPRADPFSTGDHARKGDKTLDLALQGAMWLGAGVTLVMLLSRRRKRLMIR